MTFQDGVTVGFLVYAVVIIFVYFNNKSIVSIKEHREVFINNTLKEPNLDIKKTLINLELADLYALLNKENKIIISVILSCLSFQLFIYIKFSFVIFIMVFLAFITLVVSTSKIKSQILLTILLLKKEENEIIK